MTKHCGLARLVYFCMKFFSKFIKITNMASKIQQIVELAPHDSVLFGSWLSVHGLDARSQ